MLPIAPHDLALSRRALLLSLRPDSEAFSSAVAPAMDRIDWEWVLALAKTHKVAALLAARLETSGIGAALDAEMRRQLDAIRADARVRAAAAERTLACLAQELGSAQIPFFVIKGSVLAHHVYREAQLRRFADVDVVVHQEHVATTEDILRAIGYREGGAEDVLATRPKGEVEKRAALDLTRQFDKRLIHAHTWYAPDDGRFLGVDLHWHLARGALQISAAQVWAHTAGTTIASTSITTLDPPATLIHLVMHATTCLLGNFRLLHLSDIAWAAVRFADQEAAVWQLAREWRVEAPLTFALQLAEQTFDLQLPIARRDAPRSWRRVVGKDSFILASPQLKTRSGPARLRQELIWGTAMRCLRWNLRLMANVSLARLRWRIFRWRNT